MLKLLSLVALLSTPADSVIYSGRAGQLDVSPPRISSPSVSIDGRMDEAVWSDAAILTGFTQYEPVEGIEASENTEVRVFYTDEAIYFGIRAYDENPELILARLGERDRVVFNDDWVRLTLDTYNDQRQGYIFYVNPLGLQTDGLWVEGRSSGRGRSSAASSVDYNPDFLWESDGHVDAEGWTAEVRIPYVSLRFREVPEQTWGIQVAREVKRRGFKQSWAPLTKNATSTLAQSGRLVGLRDIHPRRLIEVNPVITGVRVGTLETGTFQRADPEGDFGVNARVGITQNIVLDGTYNPDFSQVEADVSRLTVNERFALFFAEKRAFFLEGADIFSTPQRLVHTRQIVDPIGGAKLTAKIGGVSMGYIGALDDSPTSISGGSGRAGFNIFRARRDVGTGSTVGMLYTDRVLTDGSGAFNRLVAADARFLIKGRYTLTTQFAGSFDRTATDLGHTGFKPLFTAAFAKSGRTFNWNMSLTDIHPDFRARSGFITRAGDTQVNAGATLTRFGRAGATLERRSLSITTTNYFDHDGFWSGDTPFEHEVRVTPSFAFKGGRSLTIVLRNGYFRFRPEAYRYYTVVDDGGAQAAFVTPEALQNLKGIAIMPRTRINNQLNMNGSFIAREIPIFSEASRGYELQFRPDVQWRPTIRLQVSLNHTFSRIWRTSEETEALTQSTSGLNGLGTSVQRSVTISNKELYSTVNVTNFRLQYQFNKSLMARGSVQYELDNREALQDPTTGQQLAYAGTPVAAREGGEFQGQFLLQYEPSPGTIVYFGYSRLMVGERSYQLSRLDPVEEGFFVKFSYLFRK